MKIAVVMPAYNVEDVIAEVVDKARRYADVVVVSIDKKTKDNTAALAKQRGAEVIEGGDGKGETLLCGLRYAINKDVDVIITMDSDGQHKPEEIPKLIQAINNADIVNGSRFLGKITTSKINILGNIGLILIINLLSFGLSFRNWTSDTQSGFRAYKKQAMTMLLPHLSAKKYQFDSEVIYEAGRLGLKIKDVPITVDIARKGVTVKDGLKTAWFIFKKLFV